MKILKLLKSWLLKNWVHYTLASQKNNDGTYKHEIYIDGKLLKEEGSVNGWIRVNKYKKCVTKIKSVSIAKISVKAHKGD